jgi:hypothetical protein
MEEQAIGRIHRIGQEREVFVKRYSPKSQPRPPLMFRSIPQPCFLQNPVVFCILLVLRFSSSALRVPQNDVEGRVTCAMNRYVIRGSVEERILEMQARKNALSAEAIGGSSSTLGLAGKNGDARIRELSLLFKT